MAGHHHFYYLAVDSTQAANRAELVRELARWTGEPLGEGDFPSWRTIFRFLVGLADEAPVVVVLDEVQYLLGGEDDFASNLVAIWDRELRDRPFTLVLCASEVGVMERLQAGDSPLYRRINWSARLRPFHDRGRRSIEIDVVADLYDGAMLTGEFKWSSREVDYDLHLHLVRDLKDLARSGMAWAKRALSPKGYHLYVSAAGFTEHFGQRAAEHGRIRLVALEDLY